MKKKETLPCVKVKKSSGEEIRIALKDLQLLRTDAKITTNHDFIYLPLIRPLNNSEKLNLDVSDVPTTEFELLESRISIEQLVGFNPSFEIVGDIAVLTEDVANETLVAEAIMSLHKSIKVVAKRTSPVEGVFRSRRLKLIAGEHRTETVHKENGCRYKLDLEQVYFNPRLARERDRVASLAAQAKNGKEEVIDMFAGVGPFSIQIAKLAPQSHVTAIDINPVAVSYLRENMDLNGVHDIEAIECDIKEVYREFTNRADRIIMNLPKSAYLFLAEALSMLKPEGGIIHFYDLESAYEARAENRVEVAINKAKQKLATGLQEHEVQWEIVDARKVKVYAPYAYILGIDAKVKGTATT
ncbi:MAG: class I SAM-dependent methyltransferase [Methanosarcinales archaeon]